MGLLSWFRGSPKPQSESKQSNAAAEVPGMNGAVEVRRPMNQNVSVFEFGSVAATTDKVTLAGFCPVSDELEPCRWEILPTSDADAPQFRVIF